MTPLRRRLLEDMKLRGLSEGTQKVYIRAVSGFASHFWKSPQLLEPKHIRSYLLYLIELREIPKAKSVRSALKFLYTQTLEKDWKILLTALLNLLKLFNTHICLDDRFSHFWNIGRFHRAPQTMVAP